MVLGKLFGWGKAKKEPVFYTAQLNAPLMPMLRGDLFEDPLADMLEEAKLGSVVGGGTALTDQDNPRGVAYADVEIEAVDSTSETRDKIIGLLNQLAAPKGSLLHGPSAGESHAFGHTEGIALYMNGTDLSDEVYETCDINDVIADIQQAMGDMRAFTAWHEGPQDTGLYFFGRSYAEMLAVIDAVRPNHRNCDQSRIEQLA